jgi:hypothetical protein
MKKKTLLVKESNAVEIIEAFRKYPEYEVVVVKDNDFSLALKILLQQRSNVK